MVVVQRQCNNCGILIQNSSQAQSPECGGCALVSYCSKDCQRVDWKEGGHKHACKRFPLEKKIVQELFELEVKFLKGLSNRNKKMSVGHENYKKNKGKYFPLLSYSLSGQMALVLANVNPCCVIHSSTWSQYGPKFYDEVANPLFAKHETFLLERGFELRMLPAGAVPHGNIPHLLIDSGSYGHGLLFTDRNSDKVGLVNRVFNRAGHDMTTGEELFACFGLPPFEGEKDTLKEFSPIYYLYNEVDPAITNNLPNEEIRGSSLLHYGATGKSADQVGEHFFKCQLALNRMGITVAFDIAYQNSRRWSEEELAKAWLAAGGGDYDTARHFLRPSKRHLFFIVHCEEDPFDLDRMNRIIDIMHDMDPECDDSSTSS